MIGPKDQDSTRIQNYLEIRKIQNNDLTKILRFHADPTLFKHIVDLHGAQINLFRSRTLKGLKVEVLFPDDDKPEAKL